MKVQNINNIDRGLHAVQGADARGEHIDNQTVFSKTVSNLSAEQRAQRIQAMVEGIDRQGAILGKRADIREFSKYRQQIREFLDEVVSGGYSFEKDNAFEARGRQRFFATVKIIDEKLDALAKDVLDEQADNIAIIDKIDDIRGLLLDIFL